MTAAIGSVPGVTHRHVQAGGLSMHIAEAGEGPLVLLLHGFPESWYSWRHQLTALAEAGYHAVAPDQRGYCETGPPGGPGQQAHLGEYTMLHLTGDVIALMDVLGADQAVVAGALRRFLTQRGEQVAELTFRAMIPINVRQATEHKQLGNRVSIMVAAPKPGAMRNASDSTSACPAAVTR